MFIANSTEDISDFTHDTYNVYPPNAHGRRGGGNSLRYPLLVNHLISFYSCSGHPFLSFLVFSALTKIHIAYTSSLTSAFARNGHPHLSLFHSMHSLRLPSMTAPCPSLPRPRATTPGSRGKVCTLRQEVLEAVDGRPWKSVKAHLSIEP
ncbi:hypothetical protein QJS10_CPA02g00230 [Acorus calamus]|uniref:Uncharacterized protein n=1 Tax=Acorus calamus TaxID=4465 RepID=A0AAV9FE27_ACOCL|nr:hypothetical protein QJS10_CPA02g00230 [Acorus calamus]